MSSTTVRISAESAAVLRDLSSQRGRTMQELLDEAIEAMRRQSIFDQAETGYTRLRSLPDAWADEVRERAEWDQTLLDGLSATDDIPERADG